MTEPPDPTTPSRNDRRVFWISVISSLVGSILFAILFQPFVSLVTDGIVNVISVFYRGYIDRLFDAAAQSPGDFIIVFAFQLIAVLPLWITTLVTVAYIGYTRPRRTNTRYSRGYNWAILLALSAVVVLSLLVIVAGPTVSISANAVFQRRLMALTPVISDQERKALLGEWAMMKSAADFAKINDEMRSLAKKYHSELPNIRWLTF